MDQAFYVNFMKKKKLISGQMDWKSFRLFKLSRAIIEKWLKNLIDTLFLNNLKFSCQKQNVHEIFDTGSKHVKLICWF